MEKRNGWCESWAWTAGEASFCPCQAEKHAAQMERTDRIKMQAINSIQCNSDYFTDMTYKGTYEFPKLRPNL